MDDDHLWRMEERFWRDGVAHFAVAMHPDCVMTFSQPTGILRGDAILESLRDAPRWDEVRMDARQLARPTPTVAVLAYLADARQGDILHYRAACGSVYLRGDHGWVLVEHHQVPG